MGKIAMGIHGGIGINPQFLRKHQNLYEAGLKEAVSVGYRVLKRGGSALLAVEAAVIKLEDNYLFNAGRGSALNLYGEVEMDASIMDGRNMKAGAVSMVRYVKNPVILARIVMKKTKHVFLSGYGALELARRNEIMLEAEAYFITEHQYQNFLKKRDHDTIQKAMKRRLHGTVGAVALDRKGNLAAATSTGGTSNCLPGRIGDSCIIGAGCYANNKTCAISGTGDGEVLITNVIGHTISSVMEYKNMAIQEACDYVVHDLNKKTKGHIGVVCVDKEGNFGIAFNTRSMKRAWISSDQDMEVKIF